jgi:hypothetical protein
MACPMSALALPCGFKTPMVKIPSSTRGMEVVVAAANVVAGAAASELHPTSAITIPGTATPTAHFRDDRRMAGL